MFSIIFIFMIIEISLQIDFFTCCLSFSFFDNILFFIQFVICKHGKKITLIPFSNIKLLSFFYIDRNVLNNFLIYRRFLIYRDSAKMRNLFGFLRKNNFLLAKYLKNLINGHFSVEKFSTIFFSKFPKVIRIIHIYYIASLSLPRPSSITNLIREKLILLSNFFNWFYGGNNSNVKY